MKGKLLKKFLKLKIFQRKLLQHCIYINDKECIGPERFDRMKIAWYLNHSATPNIARKECDNVLTSDIISSEFYAIKDIKAGDEILIDYNYLNEPEHLKEDYYKQNDNFYYYKCAAFRYISINNKLRGETL